MPTYIYLLRRPSRVPCYVGKTVHPGSRLRAHQRRKVFQDTTMEILEEVPEDRSWVEAERRWIKHYLDSGYTLLNKNQGGSGAEGGKNHPRFGMKHEVASRLQISESVVRTNNKKGLGSRHRFGGIRGYNRLGVTDSIETREAYSRGQKGKNKFVGVVEIKRSGRFQARAQLNGKRHSLGHYDTPEEAYEARQEFLQRNL